MKPTEIQIQVINNISQTVDWWTKTNDILSPSHYTNCDEWWCGLPMEIEDELDRLELKQIIADQLIALLCSIRKIK